MSTQPLTNEDILEMFREIGRKQEETSRLIDRIARENAKLGDRLGELVQAMVEGGIKRMFNNLGYEFDVINPKHNFGNKALNVYGEIDILLENGRCWRVTVLFLISDNNSIGGKHSYDGLLGGIGQEVRIFSEIERTSIALFFPIIADCLRDGEDVCFVEGGIEGASSMSAGAEGDLLGGIGSVRLYVVICRIEFGNVNENGGGSRSTG